ncbi:MAG TPA: helix-turn-helix domain-containing protein [Polyangiaceae bacterium]|nr:helix-turn-helix domain-containing protein [Polyangiaceae bacterium]
MQRKSFADMECNIARSVEEVGDGWSLMILRNALLGTKRFQDFEAQLDAPPTTLARRLQTLTARGFFVRRAYASHPPREEYELTAKGLDVLPVLLALAAWGGRWLSPGGAPLELVHAQTGATIQPSVIDASTGKELRPGQVAVRPGPGASSKLKRAMKHMQQPIFGAASERGAL